MQMSFPGVVVIFLCTITVDYHFVYQIIKVMFVVLRERI